MIVTPISQSPGSVGSTFRRIPAGKTRTLPLKYPTSLPLHFCLFPDESFVSHSPRIDYEHYSKQSIFSLRCHQRHLSSEKHQWIIVFVVLHVAHLCQWQHSMFVSFLEHMCQTTRILLSNIMSSGQQCTELHHARCGCWLLSSGFSSLFNIGMFLQSNLCSVIDSMAFIRSRQCQHTDELERYPSIGFDSTELLYPEDTH